MKRENWQKVKAIFDSAVEVAPNERRAFLNNACADDGDLRREVETLLASSDEAESFMETPFAGEIAGLILDTPANQLENEQVFSHYKIVRQIGAGGMGEVYLAEDKKLDRQVAVKILNEKFSRDESSLHRFIQEAKAASSLNHPNILVIYEIGEAEEANYIVSEFIEGKTLREIVRKSPMKLSGVLDISIQIANALTAAHTAHIVHRDIKPENIMIRPDGYVKILDFGLAKLVEPKIVGFEESTVKQNQTAKGLILGTINYMSPEQAKGEKVDGRTDIFSFGGLIYEMIAGRTPFAGDSMSETFANLINSEPQPLSRFAEGVPDELTRIVAKMLRKNKDERYQTMKGLLADLKSLRETLAFDERLEKSRPPDTKNATKILQATTNDTNFQTAEKSYGFARQINRHKPLAAVGLLVLLTAIGFGVWYFTNFSANTTQIKSIAVMPLQNLSENENEKTLSLGLTDALISKLGGLNRFAVRPLSATQKYKAGETDALSFGEALKVDAILEGSLQTANNRLRVNVRLLRVADGSQIWAGLFDENETDIFKLQDLLSAQVAKSLTDRLTPQQQQQLAARPTEDFEAYQLYLRGRYAWNKRTREGFADSIRFYQAAIDRDPTFALAYAGLADAYVLLNDYNVAAPDEAYPKAKAAAFKALEIDPNLVEPRTTLAFVLATYDWNFPEAEREYRRVIEINPNYVTAHQWYGELLYTVKRFAEAEIELKRAAELDPLVPIIQSEFGVVMYYSGKYDEAIAHYSKLKQEFPNFPTTYMFSAWSYEQKQMPDESFAEEIVFWKLQGVDEATLGEMERAYRQEGRTAYLRKIAEMYEKKAQGGNLFMEYRLVHIYARLRHREKTLEWLEKGIKKRSANIIKVNLDPNFDFLRDDERFQTLQREFQR